MASLESGSLKIQTDDSELEPHQKSWKTGVIVGICGLVFLSIVIVAVVFANRGIIEPATQPPLPDEALQMKVPRTHLKPQEGSNSDVVPSISQAQDILKPEPAANEPRVSELKNELTIASFFARSKEFIFAHWKILLPIGILFVAVLVTAITVPIVMEQNKLAQIAADEAAVQKNLNLAPSEVVPESHRYNWIIGIGVYMIISFAIIFVSTLSKGKTWRESIVYSLAIALTGGIAFIIIVILLLALVKKFEDLNKMTGSGRFNLVMLYFFKGLYSIFVFPMAFVLLLPSQFDPSFKIHWNELMQIWTGEKPEFIGPLPLTSV